MPAVKLSDGTLLQMPDSPTAEDMAALEQAEAVATKKVAGSYGNAARKGVEDIAAFPTAIGNTIVENVRELTSPTSRFSIPKSWDEVKSRAGKIGQRFAAGDQMARGVAGPVLGNPVEPEGFGPKAVRNTVGNLPYYASGAGGPLKHLITSAGAGAGSAAGSELGNNGTLAEVGGGMLGYALTAALSNKFGIGRSATDVVHNATRDIPEGEFAAARAAQQRAAGQGVNLSPAQSFSRSTGLTGLEQDIGQSATQAGGFLREQRRVAAEQGRDALGRFVRSFGRDGQTPVDVQADVTRAAQNRMVQVGRVPSRLARDSYLPKDQTYPYAPGKDAIVDPASVDTLREDLVKAARTLNSPTVQDLAENVGINQGTRREIPTLSTGMNPTGKMRDYRMRTLNDLYNRTKETLDLPFGEGGVPRNDQTRVKTALKSIDDVLDEVQADRAGGKQITREAYEKVVEPRRRGLTGFAAGSQPVGSVPPEEATKSFFSAIGDSTRYRAKDIESFANDLAKGSIDRGTKAAPTKAMERGPRKNELFEQYYRQYLEQAYDASQRSKDGLQPTKDLTSFVTAVYGTPEQKNNIKSAMAQIAKGRGIDETKLVRTLDDVMSVVESATRAPVSPVKAGVDAAKNLGDNSATTISRSIGMFSQGALGSKIYAAVEAGRQKQIVKLLQSPDALLKIEEIARTTPMKRRADAIAFAILKTIEKDEE